MYFSLRWAEERLLCAYSTLFSPTKVKVHGVCKFQTVTYIVVILKPRLISHTKTYIYTVYQNLDAYRIPIPRFISQTKT
jgi:hypothetical protein